MLNENNNLIQLKRKVESKIESISNNFEKAISSKTNNERKEEIAENIEKLNLSILNMKKSVNTTISLNDFSTQNSIKSKDSEQHLKYFNLKNTVEVQLNPFSIENEKTIPKTISPSIGGRITPSLCKYTLNTSFNRKENNNSISKFMKKQETTPNNKVKIKFDTSSKTAIKPKNEYKLLRKEIKAQDKKDVLNKSKKQNLRVTEYNHSILNSDIFKSKKDSTTKQLDSLDKDLHHPRERTKETLKFPENMNFVLPKNISKFSKVVTLDIQKRTLDDIPKLPTQASVISTNKTNLNENTNNDRMMNNLNNHSFSLDRSDLKSVMSLYEARKMKSIEKINKSFSNDSKSLSNEKFSLIINQISKENSITRLKKHTSMIDKQPSNNLYKINITKNTIKNESSDDKTHFKTDDNNNSQSLNKYQYFNI